MKLPVITMGVMNTSNPALVRAALSNGLYYLDTAQTYQRGTNESMIGEVLKGRPRDSFAIATKARLAIDRTTGLYTEDATEEAYAQKIDTSLTSLGLDYIDIYHHHGVWVKETALYEPVLNALAKAKQAGKIRFIGITTHRNEPEVINAAVDSKVYDGAHVQVTDRGRVVAELLPPGASVDGEQDPGLAALERSGLLRPGGKNRAGLYPAVQRSRKAGRARRLLDAVRGDRSLSSTVKTVLARKRLS